MNYEFLENAIKAKQYGEAAVKSLIPDDLKQHFDVIRNELTDMTIEYLQKHRKNQSEASMKHDTGTSERTTSNGNVKKVTIE